MRLLLSKYTLILSLVKWLWIFGNGRSGAMLLTLILIKRRPSGCHLGFLKTPHVYEKVPGCLINFRLCRTFWFITRLLGFMVRSHVLEAHIVTLPLCTTQKAFLFGIIRSYDTYFFPYSNKRSKTHRTAVYFSSFRRTVHNSQTATTLRECYRAFRNFHRHRCKIISSHLKLMHEKQAGV